MADVLISIIVPVYNVEKYLNNCIESLVCQTYDNIEIILIDDGSSDYSSQICDEWADKDRRIKAIHKENGGASSARNAGLDFAKGDFIGFVDGDDYVNPDMYEILLDTIGEYHADAAACGIVRESESGYKEIWADHTVREFNKPELLKWIGEAAGILPVSPCNKLFSKNCLQNIKFNANFKYAEDTLFNFQAATGINKLVLKCEPYYHYVNNSNSASHMRFDENRFDEHRVMDIIFSSAYCIGEVREYCIKGDVLKSFRTIREMCVSSSCMERFKEIRKRIITHKKEIFGNGIYSKATKLKTLLLYLLPGIYKITVKIYGIYSEKKNKQLMG